MVSKDGIVLVNWMDNKPVVLASNFIGIGKQDEAHRWNKATKSFVKVNRPEIIQKYNASMGGIDTADALIAFYRSKAKSRKWTVRMLFHAVNMTIVNSWLEYKRDMKLQGKPRKKILDLLHFRMEIGKLLVKLRVQDKKRVGIPPSVDIQPKKRHKLEI